MAPEGRLKLCRYASSYPSPETLPAKKTFFDNI